MEYGAIAGVDKPVARLVLGTMIISAREQERSNALLDAVFEQGGNAFDTAIVYAGGESERGLGAWMEARGNREQVVIISKGCHHNADRKRVTPFDLAADLHDSLARLRTDYVDVYLLHRDDPAVEVGPIVEAFNEHLAAGRLLPPRRTLLADARYAGTLGEQMAKQVQALSDDMTYISLSLSPGVMDVAVAVLQAVDAVITQDAQLEPLLLEAQQRLQHTFEP